MAYQIKKDPINKIPKGQLIFWIIVRIAMLGCAAYSFIKGGHENVVMGWESIFCFIFTHLWDMFQIFGNGSFIEEVPPLSQTMLNAIIFVGIVIGSYGNIFDNVLFFDKFMHIFSGFVWGFSILSSDSHLPILQFSSVIALKLFSLVIDHYYLTTIYLDSLVLLALPLED